MFAGSEQLPMSLVDVRLHLFELLECPLRDIDQHLDLLSCHGIKSGDGPLKFVSELAIIAKHKVKNVDHLVQSLLDKIVYSWVVDRQ